MPIGRVATFRNGADCSDIEVDAGGYPVYGSGGEFKRASAYLYNGESVLFGRKGTIDRPLLVSGKFWTVDTMYYTELSRALNARFFYYYATTIPYAYYSTSTALPSVTQGDLAAHRMLLPPLAEQRAIADFLDRETAQIDTLIAQQQHLIELLEERRGAAIASSTAGRVGPPPNRDGTTPLGRNFSVTLGKMLDSGKEPPRGAQVLPYVRAANLQDAGLSLADVNSMPYTDAEAKELDLRAMDLLVVEGGAIGTSVLLREDLPGWSFQKTVNRVRSLGQASTSWLGYVLRAYRDAGILDIVCNKSTIPHLTAEKLRALRVPLVDPQEQRRVAARLDRVTGEIDEMVVEVGALIDFARERRAALIAAAVTGHIEVRDMAA